MKNFRLTSIIAGWIVFSIALISYWLTMEPTASFWDCGEFISASYKLQVPHPPGAPFFLLIGRLFSFLSFGDPQMVPYWINFSSVLAGAFTSMFLFWSIILFAKKFFDEKKDLSTDKMWSLLGAGFVGSLAYTFCDSAWFSNVEAEVYAMSSFFTAFVVWAMLRWETITDDAQSNRWLIFIFYVMGLSIGVHLLNLVTIPALALIYYFKKYKPGFWGIAATLSVSLLIIYTITELIIPGLPSWAGGWELFFVNSAGLPFGSGALLFALTGISLLVFVLVYSHRKQKQLLNTFALSLTFILIGYSSYAMVVIRSGFNPPINENDPSDVMSFVRYLKREQYGTRPLLYGPYFTAKVESWEHGAPIYRKGKEKYEVTDHKVEVKYSAKDQTILPRTYSADPTQQQAYREILNLKEGQKPTFAQNLQFMFSHQIGWMYVRYFFFNFAGRESDEQNANWIGPRQWFEKLPAALEENKGRNNFFMIPFVLGIIGMYFQLIRDQKNFFVLGLLFVLTGVALVVYLNSPPAEPRERDYIYAGSYYAFCFWIGFAVIALTELMNKLIRNYRVTSGVTTLICCAAPLLMASQGWNDHNRSNRYFSVDTGINDLQSCAPNSILFTGGDNDTFIQWYVQEVEGVRPDVRVIVSSYFNTEWYIRQTMRPMNNSDEFPYTLTAHHYREGGPNNPYVYYYDAGIKSMDLRQFLDLIKKEHKGLRLYPNANVVPSKDIVLKVDVEKVRAMRIVPQSLEELIVPEMHLQLKENGLEVKDLAMLDILATADWNRPIYVTYTALRQFNVDLSPYVVREGNVLRILPVLNPNPRQELINTADGYDHVMNKFQFRGLDDENGYFSEDYRRAVQNHRNNLHALAEALIEETDTVKAKQVLFYEIEKMPDQGVRYDITNLDTIRLLFVLGEKEKAILIADTMKQRSYELAEYYYKNHRYGNDLNLNMAILGEVARLYYINNELARAKQAEELYTNIAEPMNASRSDM